MSLCNFCPRRQSCRQLCPAVEQFLPADQAGKLRGEFSASSSFLAAIPAVVCLVSSSSSSTTGP